MKDPDAAYLEAEYGFAETVVAPGAFSLLPVQSFVYPSEAMEPTLRAGDHLYARKGGFGVDEPYVQFLGAEASPAYPDHLETRDQFGPFRVPEGTVFVLGDNRDQSFDSRFLGPVPVEDVFARPLYVYWNSRPFGGRDYSRIGTRIE